MPDCDCFYIVDLIYNFLFGMLISQIENVVFQIGNQRDKNKELKLIFLG